MCFPCLRNWFELTDLTVEDVAFVQVSSTSSPMQNKDKPVNNIKETKSCDTSKELLLILTKEIEHLLNEWKIVPEKIQKVEKNIFLM